MPALPAFSARPPRRPTALPAAAWGLAVAAACGVLALALNAWLGWVAPPAR